MDANEIAAARRLAAEAKERVYQSLSDAETGHVLADLVDQLANELDLVLKTTRTGELRDLLAAAKAERDRLRQALKEYAEPWNWDVVDGHRRLWANKEDGNAIADRTLHPEPGNE
jgi:hypothetical protein